MDWRSWVAACALVLVGCGSETVVGSSCDTDADCGSFKCLRDKYSNSSNMCVDGPGGGTCSPACSTQADCKKYGANFSCALAQIDIACNPTGICRDDFHQTCTPGPCREAPAN